MERSTSFLVVGLVIGLVAGYGVGFVTYQPQISRLQSELSETLSEFESLQRQVVEFQNLAEHELVGMLDLEKQIIKMWVHLERGEQTEFNATLHGLESYVNAVGDVEIMDLWNESLTHYNAEEYAEAYAKLADLAERNSFLIQNLFIQVAPASNP